MKKSVKLPLVIILLALTLYVGWLVLRPGRPKTETVSETSRGPSFAARVEKPRMDRFLFGILPTVVEEKLTGGELRFNETSRGARVGNVAPDRVELSADGWELLIEADGEGRITTGTRLVFPIEIAEVQYTLRCRPADRPTGHLRTATRADSANILDGQFVVEIAHCVNAATGKVLDTEAGGSPGDAWPSEPLTLRGSFAGLPHANRRGAAENVPQAP